MLLGSPLRRDAFVSTRDECAPRNCAHPRARWERTGCAPDSGRVERAARPFVPTARRNAFRAASLLWGKSAESDPRPRACARARSAVASRRLQRAGRPFHPVINLARRAGPRGRFRERTRLYWFLRLAETNFVTAPRVQWRFVQCDAGGKSAKAGRLRQHSGRVRSPELRLRHPLGRGGTLAQFTAPKSLVRPVLSGDPRG